MSLEGHSIPAYRDCGVWFRAGGNQIRVQVHDKEVSRTPETQHVAQQILHINQSPPGTGFIAVLSSCGRCGV